MEGEWEGQQQQENEPEEEDILDMGDDDQGTNDKESLLMRFCPHDSSMLYPQVSLINNNRNNERVSPPQ